MLSTILEMLATFKKVELSLCRGGLGRAVGNKSPHSMSVHSKLVVSVNNLK